MIAAGEKVLTNGVTMVRVRCGNSISMQPLEPVAETDPPVEVGQVMTARLVVVIAMVAAAGAARLALRPVDLRPWQALESLLMNLGDWHGQPGSVFSAEIVGALGVDEHVNRTYRTAGGGTASVYVGYYRSQEQGASIHSPMNCLPGAGWEPVEAERIPLAHGAAKRVLIRKGAQQYLVIYWYQTARRVEGDEYRSRFYTVLDTIRYRRNDAALVRIMVPYRQRPGWQAWADRAARDVASRMEPEVRRLLFAS